MHIIEWFHTSDNSVERRRLDKLDQHDNRTDALVPVLRAAGWRNITVHTVGIGHSGVLSSSFTSMAAALELTDHKAKSLATALAVHTVTTNHHILSTRKGLKHNLTTSPGSHTPQLHNQGPDTAPADPSTSRRRRAPDSQLQPTAGTQRRRRLASGAAHAPEDGERRGVGAGVATGTTTAQRAARRTGGGTPAGGPPGEHEQPRTVSHQFQPP